jgi:hypothetical protein
MTDGGPSVHAANDATVSAAELKPAAPAVRAAADKQHNDNYDDEKRVRIHIHVELLLAVPYEGKVPFRGSAGESEQGRPAHRNTDEARVRFKKRQRRLSEYNARRRCVTNWP